MASRLHPAARRRSETRDSPPPSVARLSDLLDSSAAATSIARDYRSTARARIRRRRRTPPAASRRVRRAPSPHIDRRYPRTGRRARSGADFRCRRRSSRPRARPPSPAPRPFGCLVEAESAVESRVPPYAATGLSTPLRELTHARRHRYRRAIPMPPGARRSLAATPHVCGGFSPCARRIDHAAMNDRSEQNGFGCSPPGLRRSARGDRSKRKHVAARGEIHRDGAGVCYDGAIASHENVPRAVYRRFLAPLLCRLRPALPRVDLRAVQDARRGRPLQEASNA